MVLLVHIRQRRKYCQRFSRCHHAQVLIRLQLIHHCVCVPAHLVLIPFIAKVFDQTLHTFRCRAPPVGPGVGTKGLIPDQGGNTQIKYMSYNHVVTLFYRITFKLHDSIISTQCQPVVCASLSDVGFVFRMVSVLALLKTGYRLSVSVMVHVYKQFQKPKT